MSFNLHPNLQSKIFVIDLALSRVLLENNKHYPWIFLVPRRNNISKLMDLSKEDQLTLLDELDKAQKVLWQLFKPTQLNVAAIGNKTPQLHVHIIARNEKDPAWPGTVWDVATQSAYSVDEQKTLLAELTQAFTGNT